MMKSFLFAAIAALALSTTACNKLGGSAKVETEDQKTLYAVGLMLGRNLSAFNLTPAELEIVKQGIADQVGGKKPIVALETYGPKINTLMRSRADARATAEKAKSKGFLAEAAKEAGAEQLPSGMVFKSLTAGTGDTPKATDRVKVHYRGTLTDGTEFDSSFKRGQPAEFPLNGVIPCWTEGLQKMKVGEKAKLVCPSNIAYGDMGRPPSIPGGATLVFEVELLEISKAPATPPMPQLSLPPPGTRPSGTMVKPPSPTVKPASLTETKPTAKPAQH